MQYFKEYRRRIFPKPNALRFVSLSELIFDYRGGKLAHKENPPATFLFKMSAICFNMS